MCRPTLSSSTIKMVMSSSPKKNIFLLTDELLLKSREKYRFHSFDKYTKKLSDIFKRFLVRSGFYYDENESIIKCFICNAICHDIPQDSNLKELIKKIQYYKVNDLITKRLHDPLCGIADGSFPVQISDSEQYLFRRSNSYKELFYENVRFQTFFNWPLGYALKPRELAANGFYYSKFEDHCICAFCRGIIGAWEPGDTPMGEHKRHFPHCDFVNGIPCGNIPQKQCDILNSLYLEEEEPPLTTTKRKICCSNNNSITNTTPTTAAATTTISCNNNNQLLTLSNNRIQKLSLSSNDENVSWTHLGFISHIRPANSDYISYDIRLNSFYSIDERPCNNKNVWADVTSPEQLAEAGFYYCGLTDHVKCYHCGNGVRNWHYNEDPLMVHAILYPNCELVLCKKGQKLKNDDITFHHHHVKKQNSGVFKSVSQTDMEVLLKLDLMIYAMNKGIDKEYVALLLKQKLESTGIPFLSFIEFWDVFMARDIPTPPSLILKHQLSSLDQQQQQQQQQHEEVKNSERNQNYYENKKEKEEENINNKQCKICENKPIEILYVPCFHMITCSSCAPTVISCPVCRTMISYIIKPILP